FFFSSRRRHTRFSRDWSSDVCSSDLIKRPALFLASFIAIYFLAFQLGFSYTNISHFLSKQAESSKYLEFNKTESQGAEFKFDPKIGRASCRERVHHTEGARA